MNGQDHLRIVKKGVVQEQSLVAHHTLMFQPQKNINTNQKIFCLRDRTQTI